MNNIKQLYKKAAILQHLQAPVGVQSVVGSVLSYAVVSWGGSTTKASLPRLKKLVRRASSVVSMKLGPLVTVAERRTLNKL